MEAATELGWVTTALVNNIHCASCVSYIRDVFARFGGAVYRVETSTLSQEVRIHHAKSLHTSDIWLALSRNAFEIHSAITVNSSGVTVEELNLTKYPDGWLEAASDRLIPPSQVSAHSRISCLEFADKNKRTHLENCAACREEYSLRETNARPVSLKSITSDSGDAKLGNRQRQMQLDGAYTPPGVLRSMLNVGEKELPKSETVENTDRRDVQAHNVILSIGGMTCASCATSISHVLSGLDFVQTVEVNLMTNSATVTYSGAKELSEKIVEAVEDTGFDASIADDHYSSSSIPASNISLSKPDELRFKAVFNIGGMTCASCTSSIEESLRKLPFTESVNITLLANSAVVTFSDKKNLEKIVDTVKDLGYDCTIEHCDLIELVPNAMADIIEAQRTIQMRIDGMFCKHCPTNIVDAINSKFPGHVHIDKPPSLKDPVMKILYTPTPPDFTIRDIFYTVDSLNPSFSTKIHHPASIEQRSQAMQVHEQRRLLRRLLLSLTVAIPTFLIGVVWMSLVPSSNHQRIFFEKPMWSGRASRAEWALCFLSSPVMFCAADIFHIRAIKEIRALWRRSSRVPILRRFYRFGSMNLLISAGTCVAYFSSVALLVIAAKSTKDSSSHDTTYFDSVVFLTFFILIGRYLEAYSKSKTGNTVASLSQLRPQEAILVTNLSILDRSSQGSKNKEADGIAANYSTTKVKTDLLEVADVVLVPHGSSPPADGIILTGSTKFNESSLTGESWAVSKSQHDRVFAGSLNIGSPISIRITDVSGTSMLDQIISVVREGQTRRAPVERVVDSMTAYFVPVITALAILTFIIWFSLGQSGVLSKRYLDSEQGGWAFWSLEFAIAVFVVACPCGIGLAAPTALFVGGGLAAKNGILVRGGGEAFQEASNVDIVVFDKTGTLTEGENLEVVDHEMIVNGMEAEIAWSITKSMEENSSHPMARALLDFTLAQHTLPLQAASITEIAGLGLRCVFDVGDPVSGEQLTYEAALGSESLISSLDPPPDTLNYFIANTLSLWKSQSKSIALLALRRLAPASSTSSATPSWVMATIFAISDPIRPSAFSAISALHMRNIPVYMLTGDNITTAAAVASSLSIPLTNVFASVLPTEKAAKIQHLQSHGPRISRYSYLSKLRLGRFIPKPPPKAAVVAFVGDGINDAPALSTASVSICVASASHIAQTSSSFVLLSPSLENIITLLDLSKRVFTRVKFNFGWAVTYNACLVPVAAGVLFKVRGEAGWRLGPVWGSAAMAFSSLSVVLSSLALRWWR